MTIPWDAPATIWLKDPVEGHAIRNRLDMPSMPLREAVQFVMGTSSGAIEGLVIQMDDATGEYIGAEIAALAKHLP